MSQAEPLTGRIYAITGGSKGMGLRFARALTADGAKVILLARPSKELDAAAAEIPGAMAIPCDVGSSADVRKAFAAIGERFGKLDGLINNAAACLVHKIEEASDEEIHAQVNANLIGPLLCIRSAIPLLRASGAGDIVNISSESVRTAFPYLTLYAATKAGLENLSAGLRAELRPDKIRVTVLRSGSVSGSSIGGGWDPERAQAFMAAMVESGCAAFTGTAVKPETMADMLVQVLRLPREANLDMVELRAI
jgi:NAD(P)-dependent dehydrogenase (short-subunit alcohol dehydrogenase family)